MDIQEILSKLVSFDTVNNPAEGVKPAPDILVYIEDLLSSFGYNTYVFNKKGYYSLIAFNSAVASPKVLFLGHCDVVPPGPNWTTDPFKFTVKDDFGYGRGVADMKGSVAVMLKLAKELNTKKVENNSAVFAFTLDEESGGEYGAGQLIKHLKKLNLIPDYVINGDANGLQIVTKRRNPYVITIHLPKDYKRLKGTSKKKLFKTEIAGNRTMHAAYFIKDLDTHCAVAASEFLKKNNFLVKSVEGSFIKNNVLPEQITVEYIDRNGDSNEIYDENLTNFFYAVAGMQELDFPSKHSDYGINLTFNYYREENRKHFVQLDLRLMAKGTKTIKHIIRDYFKHNNVHCKIEVKGSIGPVMTPDDSILVKKAIQIAKIMGLASHAIELGGATDSRWFSAIGIPTIEFGPIGKNVHGPNEGVKIESLELVKDYYENLYSALLGAEH